VVGKVLEVGDRFAVDRMACDIANNWFSWNVLRQPWKNECQEVRDYIFATDTTKTTNAKLPWKNKTTVPKLCQIRDNLLSNYTLTLFPKKKYVDWQAYERDAATEEKKKSITGYMYSAIEYKSYRDEMLKAVQDYIDYGNAFLMPEWYDGRVETKGGMKVGYVGTVPRRISPLDIVFNPMAPSFYQSPKIIRSIVTIGEVKKFINSLTTDDNREVNEKLWTYIKDLRQNAEQYAGEFQEKDRMYLVDGFTSYQMYLQSNYVELLTFYGDIYDLEGDKLLENKIITIADRHKIIAIQDNPSIHGQIPIYHVSWRKRQDNLWGQSPLANLVGLQYRIDHIENLKADVFDLITFPPLKIRGSVDDFEWGPMVRIHCLDKDSDVEMLAPPFNVLTANIEIQNLIQLMEEMAGAPKEAMGFRTPGEKTKYEVQRMENAASRIYQSKVIQFEVELVEEYLNGALELSKRKVTSDILVRYFDDELKANLFMNLTPDDLTGLGRIRPYAARHFAEQAELIQNLTSLMASPLGQLVQPHVSSINLAKMLECIFDVYEWKIFTPFVALAEQADAQRIAQVLEEQVLTEALQGISPENLQFVQNAANATGQDQPQTAAPTPPGYGTVPGSNFRTGPLGGGGY
jgi:hypothetical protein